jgi:hypothetical protein
MTIFNCLFCNKENYKANWKPSGKYCSSKCQNDHQYKTFIEKWKSDPICGNVQYGTSSHVKRYIIEKYQSKCAECGISEWKGKPLTLTVEHIDGDAYNNKEENLTLLCPNCHSQTSTFGGRNKGKGT